MTNKKMNETAGKSTFFRLVGGKKGGIKEFRETVEEHYDKFKKRKFKEIPTLEINKDKYYIQAMDTYTLDEKYENERMYCWLINISRVDVNQDIVIADVTKDVDDRRRKVEHSENEGLVSDTRILFDPFRNIIVLLSKRGCINVYDLRRFISKIINVPGIKLEIIVNKDGIRRINTMDIVEQISYKVAAPDNFSTFKEESRSELADMRMASKFKAETMKVVIGANELNKRQTLNKVKTLLTGDSGIIVDALSVEGLSQGRKDTIDLIKNKLEYRGMINHEDELDDKSCFGFLVESYNIHFEYLSDYYKISLGE